MKHALFRGLMMVALAAAGCASDGKDGANGANGQDGTDGQDGTNGTDGTNGQDGTSARALVTFDPVAFAATDSLKRQAVASSSITVNGETTPISYNVLLRSGDQPGGSSGGTYGLVVDEDGNPVLEADGSPEVSDALDFSSILPVDGKLWQVTHVEGRPGGMYLTELSQDSSTGAMTAMTTAPIDFSSVDGLWVPCAGSVTPWNTHLGSEEYPPDARAFEAATVVEDLDSYVVPMFRYFGLDIYSTDGGGNLTLTMSAVRAAFNPYRYGFPTEVTIAGDGTPSVAKHYSMGRVAVELAKVMPDQKTVYISDDGTNVGFFLFIADTAGDLTAGELYAMRWYQTSDAGAGTADIEWVDLGHATDGDISTMLHDGQGPAFSDIFDAADPVSDGVCPTDYLPVHVGGAPFECLKVKSGMDEAASRLETRRYAAIKGATLELRKEEGITVDPIRKTLYVSMSAVEKGMEDGNAQDLGGPNDVRLAKNKCGAVYALDLGNDPIIGSDWVALSWRAEVEGRPASYPAGSPYEHNSCSVNGIANPDNLSFIPSAGVLLIGEDTGSGHQNDVVWAYDITTRKLTRIFSTPYGAETTSLYWYPNVNGFAYIRTVVQHPYGESDSDKLTDPADARAYDGLIGPIPAFE